MKEFNSAIREYLNFLIVERALSPHTVSAYERDLRAFAKFLSARAVDVDHTEQLTSIASLSLRVLEEYVAELRALERSESSIARAVVSIRNLAEFTCRELGVSNPIKEFKPPKSARRLPKALTLDEVNALIDATSRGDDATSIRNRAIVELLYATGARISEIVDLNLSDISKLIGEEVVSVKLTGKGGKDRIVPVGKYAQQAIDQYVVRIRPNIAARQERALFVNARGTRLTRQSMWKVVADAAVAARIDHVVSPHSLRHSFATHLLDGGADVRVVQELLGHASVTTTQIYTLVTIDKLRENYSSAHPRAF